MKVRRAQENHTHADLLARIIELEGRFPDGVFGNTSFLGRSGFGTATKNDITYACGGFISGSVSAAVSRSTVQADGGLTPWTACTDLPAARGYPGAAIVGNYIYVCGGQNSGATAQTSVYYAEIQGDGSLGSWSTGTVLPALRTYPMVFSYGTKLYVMGGFTGAAAVSTIYVATPDSGTGAVGSWTTNATPLWANRYGCGLVMWNDRVYLTGGTSYAAYQKTVYSAQVSGGAIGSWTAHTDLPANATWPGLVMWNDALYSLGGDNPASNLVYRADIGGGGAVTSWDPYSALPAASWSYGATALHSGLGGGLACFGSVLGGGGFKIVLT